VGVSPILVLAVFLGAAGLWLVYTGYGLFLAASPSALVLLTSLPPIHSLLDLQFLSSGGRVNGWAVAAFGVGVLLLRSLLMSFWTSMLLERFGSPAGDPAPAPRLDPTFSWTAYVRPAARRSLRNLGNFVAIEVFFLFALVAIPVLLSVFGPALLSLALVAELLGGTYLLAYLPVVVAAEGVSIRRALSLAYRGSRLPGPRHMTLVAVYLSLIIIVFVLTPASRVAEATPSFLVWLVTLAVSLVHVVFLGCFVYRWLVIRDHVLTAPAPVRARRERQPRLLRGFR